MGNWKVNRISFVSRSLFHIKATHKSGRGRD